MHATPKLRFVERDCYSKNGEHFTHPFKQRVLQQWWEDPNVVLAVIRFGPNGFPQNQYAGEWRDVPLEEEK